LKLIRVILADDNIHTRGTLRRLIERGYPGCGIAEAENGLEAVRAAEREPPDLVILDISMPVMDGLIAARCIKALCPDVPVIIVSGSIDAGSPEEAFHCGAQGYVSKLTLATELIAAMDTVLAGAPYSG